MRPGRPPNEVAADRAAPYMLERYWLVYSLLVKCAACVQRLHDSSPDETGGCSLRVACFVVSGELSF
jgi:hypothetical protein